jgi:CTP:molybdopterin cytidylyltransferase MocA
VAQAIQSGEIGEKMQNPVSILILAAGASSRMRGADKLLEPVEGGQLLRQIAAQALRTGRDVVVTLAKDRPARGAALAGLDVRQVAVPQAQDGMSASLREGIAAIPPDHGVLVLLADMPEIDADDLKAMLWAYDQAPGHIHRGTAADGRPGHPVLFPAWARAELLALTGDAGAKPVLEAHRPNIRLVPLPGTHAITDLDTPEDWAHWRAAQP